MKSTNSYKVIKVSYFLDRGLVLILSGADRKVYFEGRRIRPTLS